MRSETQGNIKPGHGGARPGAGRPRGALNRSTIEIREAFATLERGDVDGCSEVLDQIGEKDPLRAISTLLALSGEYLGKPPRVRADQQLSAICGARRTRGRGICQCTALYANGRCRVHGGPSTGPKTADGRARSLAALAKINSQRKAKRMSMSMNTKAPDVPKLEGTWRERARESGRDAPPPVIGASAAETGRHELDPPFDSILRNVGADDYAHASARAYVQLTRRGNRPRYAKM